MKLEILSPADDLHLDRASAIGVANLQLRVGPDFPISTDDANLEEAHAAGTLLANRGLTVTSLGFYRNMLTEDPALRRIESARLLNVMRMAVDVFAAPLVGVFAGRSPEKTIEENMESFAAVWGPIAVGAERLGVRIAFENCTMFRGYPVRGINMAHNPHAYRLMFAALPSAALGIEFDPSHCLKQRIDVARFLREFGPRIYHVHAKDHERLAEEEYTFGSYDPRSSRDRFPGHGQVDWPELFALLREIGYEGNVAIEAENDPDAASEDDKRRLLKDAARMLEQAMSV